MNKNCKVLWIDDDHQKERFELEIEIIQEDLGWTVECVGNLEKASLLLAEQPYDALLLDQQFYVYEEDERNTNKSSESNIPWQGITLLYWLRNYRNLEENKKQLADHSLEYVGSSIEELYKNSGTPLAHNSHIDVCVFSAFYHEDILAALRNASDKDADLQICSKPIDIHELESFLNSVKTKLAKGKGLGNGC